MGNFNRGGGRDRGGFGGRRNDRDGDRPTMHKAICGECGDNCQVPFKPTNGKPVLCSDCFGGQSGGSRERGRSGGGFGSRERGRSGDRHDKPRHEDRQMHDAVCTDCGDDCQVPFRPTGDKPIFCNNCFGGKEKRNGRADKFTTKKESNNSAETLEQIKILSSKIDKLIEILAPKDLVEKNGLSEISKIEKLETTKKEKKIVSKKVSPKKKK